MKKCLAVTVAVVALVCCQPIDATIQINKQSDDRQDEYQEEAYPIGQQEEAYYEQTKTQQE